MGSRLKQKLNSAPMPRKHNAAKSTVKDFERHLNDLGMEPGKAIERAKSKSKSRGRSSSRRSSDPSVGPKRRRDDVDFSPGEGLKNAKQKKFAKEKPYSQPKKTNGMRFNNLLPPGFHSISVPCGVN